MQKDQTTEEKIKLAAKKLFHEKGYGQTKTRDIAEAAGINTALLNYYFRSKENLFNIIMLESLQDMFFFIRDLANEKNSNLEAKIEAIVNRYIEIFREEPNLPLFVLSEIQADPERLMQKSKIPKNILTDSYFFKQIDEQIKKSGVNITPIHVFLNIISLTILPVVARPIISYMYDMNTTDTKYFIEERRQLIPLWIKTMLKLDK
ncbi:TetR/AcrR family transcriptional regulator [Dysgonomonas reticulitermitis]